MTDDQKYSIFIGTPLFGGIETAGVSALYHTAILSLMSDPGINCRAFMVNCDLVRARSRLVRLFLETDCTHLLFWDSDVVPRDLRVIGTMLGSGHDFVALPYPKKTIDWNRISSHVFDEREQSDIGRQTGEQLEALGQQVPAWLEGGALDEHGFGEVRCIGFGFALLSRACCQRMVDAYRHELEFIDIAHGHASPTVALFQLVLTDRALLHEDFSFCHRWRALGGKCMMYAYPADHVGGYVYRGHEDALYDGPEEH